MFVRTKFPEKKWHFFGSGNISYSVDYDILVPETMPLSARNKFGDVTVEGLKAGATIVNSNGKVAFSDGRGGQRIENSFGAITVTRNAGDVDDLGRQRRRDRRPTSRARVTIQSRFGGVDGPRIKGTATIKASNGGVPVEEATGPAAIVGLVRGRRRQDRQGHLEMENSNGEVTADGVRRGEGPQLLRRGEAVGSAATRP